MIMNYILNLIIGCEKKYFIYNVVNNKLVLST